MPITGNGTVAHIYSFLTVGDTNSSEIIGHIVLVPGYGIIFYRAERAAYRGSYSPPQINHMSLKSIRKFRNILRRANTDRQTDRQTDKPCRLTPCNQVGGDKPSINEVTWASKKSGRWVRQASESIRVAAAALWDTVDIPSVWCHAPAVAVPACRCTGTSRRCYTARSVPIRWRIVLCFPWSDTADAFVSSTSLISFLAFIYFV